MGLPKFFFILVLSSALQGQPQFHGIKGRTIDPSGLSVPNVRVVLHNIGTGDQLNVLTDTRGNFAFGCIPDGDYRLTISSDGFFAQTIEKIAYFYPKDLALSVHMIINPPDEQFIFIGDPVVLNIVDSATKQNLGGARALVLGPGSGKDTEKEVDSCGRVYWYLKPGDYSFKIAREGYQAKEISIRVSGPRSLTVDLEKIKK
jgi:hypothetical protein